MARASQRFDLVGILARINQRLEDVGLSEHAASKQAGKPDAIRNLRRAIESGGRAGISTATISALAEVLGATPAWLLDGTGPNEASTAERLTAVPLISWVSAGDLSTPEAVEEMNSAPKVYAEDLPSGDWIALRVVGDSMDRISPPESVIFVNRGETRRVPNACYVIAGVDGESTYKRYRTDPERFEPVSTNLSLEPIYLSDTVQPRIIGRVRRTVLDM